MRRSPRRDGGSLLGALALGVIVLAWPGGASAEDATYGAEPPYEGYGPVEDYLLGDSNPPVPTPITRRFLREYFPDVAETMRTWPPFFRDSSLDFHIRSFYFNRELPVRPAPANGRDTFNQEAWALGGWVGLQSGWLLDTFRMGAVDYFSQPAYAPDSRDGTGLL